MNLSTEALAHKALCVRRTVLEMAARSQSGHVTTAFSQAELLCALYYGGLLRGVDPQRAGGWRHPERDRFILSKGQGGLGLYPILADLGFFPLEELDDFAGRGRILGVHAEWNVPGIEIVSGSLGHGLPIATGIATALTLRNSDARVVVLTGDAELYEGSNWEALIYAASVNLDNLIVIVDRNGMGTIGKTDPDDTLSVSERPQDGPCLNPLADKFTAFGFDVVDCDGHDFSDIEEAFTAAVGLLTRGPAVIIASTDKGHGCKVFENQRFWHYRVPGGADLASCRSDLGLPAEGPKARASEIIKGATL